MKRICHVVLALALPLSTSPAQQTPSLAVGSRVRVGTPSRRVVGTLESVDSASIVVRRQNGATVALQREPGTRINLSTGPGMCSPGRRGSCVAIGFLGGAVVGLGVGAILVSDCNDELCGLLYLVTVPAGALVGTIVGAVVGGEHWERGDQPVRLSLAPGPTGETRLGVRLSF